MDIGKLIPTDFLLLRDKALNFSFHFKGKNTDKKTDTFYGVAAEMFLCYH